MTNDKLLLHHIYTLTKIDVKMDKCELPTFYSLPKLHKNPYKSSFISNSSHCSTTILSKHITSALTSVKDHVIKCSDTAFSNSNVNYFWSIKTLPRSSKRCNCATFRVLKYLLSIFHFIHLIATWSYQSKSVVSCLLVFQQSQKRASVLRTKRAFSATRSITCINVGLVPIYVKLLLYSWITYMCILKAWYTNK